MEKISLVHIRPNHKAKIVEVAGGAGLQRKMMHQGIYPGREVIKLNHIGLKGPVVIKVGRSILALGHSVAARIIIEAA